jgi:predicted GNAT family N-acyltransferase
VNIKVTSFEASEGSIRAIRDAVFGEEQHVAPELDWDGMDSSCIHVVATSASGRAIGTGRIQPDGKIGRLAVLKDWRGRGAGKEMLEALVETARRRGLAEVHLHAQVHAVAFYEKLGFEKVGPEFIEASINHINMVRNIRP